MKENKDIFGKKVNQPAMNFQIINLYISAPAPPIRVDVSFRIYTALNRYRSEHPSEFIEANELN